MYSFKSLTLFLSCMMNERLKNSAMTTNVQCTILMHIVLWVLVAYIISSMDVYREIYILLLPEHDPLDNYLYKVRQYYPLLYECLLQTVTY